MSIKSILSAISRHTDALGNTYLAHFIESQAKLIAACFQNGGKLLVCGNGGSAVDASHFVAEFVNRIRPKYDRQPLPALALTTDVANLTSIGNDKGFEDIFSVQVEALGNKGDILVGISTSGTSKNVVKALRVAKKLGLTTTMWRGNFYDKKLPCVEHDIVVKSKETYAIQEVLLVMAHGIVFETERVLFPKIFDKGNSK